MPSIATRNGLINRHARGKLEKRWKQNTTNPNQCSPEQQAATEAGNAQQDNLETVASTESSKSRWRSRKFHVPAVSSTESMETDEASSKVSQNNYNEVSSSPAPVETSYPYSRQRLRPTDQRKQKSSFANTATAPAKPSSATTEASSPQSAQQDTATTAPDDANTPSPEVMSPVDNKESPRQEFEAILSSAHRPVHRGGPRVRTNGSVTSRWNPGGESTPKATTPNAVASSTSNESSPFLSSTNLDKPTASVVRSAEPSKTAKPAWVKGSSTTADASDTEQQPPRRRSSVSKSLVSRWNETQAGSSPPLRKVNHSSTSVRRNEVPDTNDDESSQQTEETAPDEVPVRSRVADIKSKFQRPAAGATRAVKSQPFVKSPVLQHQRFANSKSPEAAERLGTSLSPETTQSEELQRTTTSKSPELQQSFAKGPTLQQKRFANSRSPESVQRNVKSLSPDTAQSVESASVQPKSPKPTTPEPVEDDTGGNEEQAEASKPAGWESPRRRRLRQLAEAAENPSPAPVRNVTKTSERKRGNRISDLYQSKIDRSHEKSTLPTQSRLGQLQQPAELDDTALRSAAIASPPPQEEAPPASPNNDTIETPQKMSVSAMKAMLWGNEEKLIIPARSPPSATYNKPPSSPVLATARTKFDQTGFQPSPLRRLPIPEPDPITPPRASVAAQKESTIEPLPNEEEVVAEPAPQTRSVVPPPKVVTSPEPKLPQQQPWMGRSFKKSVGAALESKIHAIWGQGEVLRIDKSTAIPPLPREKAATVPLDTGVEGERKSHCRAPSAGDFKVDTEPPSNVRGRSSAATNDPVRHRDLSPSNRPTNIPQWRSFDKGDAPLSPLRADPPSRIPSYSPQHFDPSFTEAIDAPPSESALDATDRPYTPNAERGMVSPVLSPRSKESHPWNQDARALSPASWQKRKEPMFDFDPDITTSDFDGTSVFHPNRESSFEVYGAEDEKKNTEEEQAEHETSQYSLQQLATDSFLAVDHEQARKSLRINGNTISDSSSSEGQVPESTPRGNFGSDEERGPPPVRPRADTGGGGSAIFGYPDSFGASGGVNEEVEVSVAERAKAVQSWNGGLGGTPPRPSTRQDDDVSSSVPSRPTEPTTQGMKPSMSKRGFLLDDWQSTPPVGSQNDFSPDPWTPGGMDSFTEQDWPSMREDQFSLPDAFGAGSGQDIQMFESPGLDIRGSNSTPSTKESNEVRSAANSAPTSLFVLDQPHIDAERKDIKSWRMRKGKSTSPDAAATSKAKQLGFDDSPFDPFSDAFGSKPDFTETTEPTESTDFFSQASDPFFSDILPSELTKPSPKEKSAAVKTKPYIPLVLTKTMSGERLSPTPNFSLLAPPSGSIEEVWSYEVGLTPTGSSQRPKHEEPVVYDADVSTLNESAAEI